MCVCVCVCARVRACKSVRMLCVLMYETLVCVSLCECLYVLFIVWNASQKGYRILSWMKMLMSVWFIVLFQVMPWMLLETVLCKEQNEEDSVDV